MKPHNDYISNNENEYTDSMEDSFEVELDREDSQTSSNNAGIWAEEESVYPLKDIKVEKGFYSAYELKRKYDKDPSLVILDSDFQRKGVWDVQRKRELIESVLMGLPLPIFYFNEDKKGRLIVIDGRQRLTTLFDFIDDKFSLDKLKILDEFNKHKFKDLEPILQSKIEDYQIMAHVIQPPTPDRIKFDIFDRVNRGGLQLNKQEIRNALYQGNATKLLTTLSSLPVFAQATENAFLRDKRMKDRYLLLRFIAFYLYYNKKLFKGKELYQYTSDIDEFLGVVMEYINNLNQEEISTLKNITTNALEQVNFYLGVNAFRLLDIDEKGKTKRYPININIFESIMYAMTMLPFCEISLKKMYRGKILSIKEKFRV